MRRCPPWIPLCPRHSSCRTPSAPRRGVHLAAGPPDLGHPGWGRDRGRHRVRHLEPVRRAAACSWRWRPRSSTRRPSSAPTSIPVVSAQALDMGGILDPELDVQLARLVQGGEMSRIIVWSRDGRAVYSSDPALRGQRFSIGDHLAVAFAGTSVAEYGTEADDEAGGSPWRRSSARAIPRALRPHPWSRGWPGHRCVRGLPGRSAHRAAGRSRPVAMFSSWPWPLQRPVRNSVALVRRRLAPPCPPEQAPSRARRPRRAHRPGQSRLPARGAEPSPGSSRAARRGGVAGHRQLPPPERRPRSPRG